MEMKFFVIEKIHTCDIISDIMTKSLSSEKFGFCKRQTSLVEPSKQVRKGKNIVFGPFSFSL
jgi:hypothetical protein